MHVVPRLARLLLLGLPNLPLLLLCGGPPTQRARDELAAALLMAERRAQEAEEEQLRAEATSAALAQQLADEQREAAQAAAAAAAAAGSGAATDDAVASRVAAERSGDQQQQQQQQRQQQRDKLLSEGSEAQLARDAEILLAELDRERQRSEELVRMLERAEHEAVLATDRLVKAQQVGAAGWRGGAAQRPAQVPVRMHVAHLQRWGLLLCPASCPRVRLG